MQMEHAVQQIIYKLKETLYRGIQVWWNTMLYIFLASLLMELSTSMKDNFET